MRQNLLFFPIFCIALLVALSGCKDPRPKANEGAEDKVTVTYPEKKEMLLLTDRPPQLETPLKIFRQDITPNEYFFVRWHMPQIVTKIDIDTFRLYINGAVDKPLALSINDLKTKFPADSFVALAICAGNSRSFFVPRVPGSQWANGGMGNAMWKGVKLKDVLAMAGMKPGAIDVTFQGLDKPAMPGTPAFVKSLRAAHAMDGEVLIAYEMNGRPIPMLNGYPLKLIVPGWYATYWVGALSNINVLTDTFHGFWMDKAYQVAKNPELSESPDKLAKVTVPLTNIKLHSIFVEPDTDAHVIMEQHCVVEGLAFNDGTGIRKVEVSFNNGTSWKEARMNPEIGKYSWRRWTIDWVPKAAGIYRLKVRATDNAGNAQPEEQWNRSGYARGFIEHLDVTVTKPLTAK